MNAAPCRPAPTGYNRVKRLKNANMSGTPHRQSGFFTPEIRLDFGRQSPIGGLAGMHVSNAVRCSHVQFFNPAYSPAQSRFQTAVGDC